MTRAGAASANATSARAAHGGAAIAGPTACLTEIAPRPIAYLTKRFPRLSETFILDEVLGLEAQGVPLRLFAIRDPHEPIVQPDVARVRSGVTYLRPGPTTAERLRWLGSTVACHARVAAAHPAGYATTLVETLGHRQRRAALSHFVDAGRLAALIDAAGAWHLHAAFAHGPAAVAHKVHTMTGRPFSFGAHAKDLYVSDPVQLARRAAAAEFVLACSASARDALVSIARPPDGRVRLVPHGVDVERFRPGADPGREPRAGAPDEPVRILAVGRLVEKKGYRVLLDALALVVGTTGGDATTAATALATTAGPEPVLSALHAPPARRVACRIVGDGPLRSELEAAASSLGIGDMVTFEGALDHGAVARAYAEADVFVQCSIVLPDGDRDGIPNVVLEAMASGLPVVGSDVAGIPEVVVDGVTGVLVPPSDPRALAGRIARLAADPMLRASLGAAARARVVAHFDRRAAVGTVAALVRGAACLDPRPAPARRDLRQAPARRAATAEQGRAVR